MCAKPPPMKRILVVEDDLVLQGAIKLVLEWEGYRVSCAADGQEALDQLRCGNRPDVILLDWMLPVLDGGRFLQEQRQDPALAAIPVISVTALEEADCPGTAGFVKKPFQPPELLEAIRRHC